MFLDGSLVSVQLETNLVWTEWQLMQLHGHLKLRFLRDLLSLDEENHRSNGQRVKVPQTYNKTGKEILLSSGPS